MRQRNAPGFTLIELVVTITVLGIIASLGIPAMRGLVASAAMQAHVTTYAQALHTARHLAVSRGRPVTLCALDAQQRCSGRWRQHLSIFEDNDRDGTLASARDILVDVVVKGDDDIRVEWRGFGARHYLTARPDGRWRQNGRFRFCDARHPEAGRAIVVNVTGRTRAERETCARP